VVPVGTKSPSLSGHVAKALCALKQIEGVKYQLTAMGTIVEGELDAVMEAVRQMHESLFDKDTKRVVTTVMIDDRRDKQLTMVYKVDSVLKKLG